MRVTIGLIVRLFLYAVIARTWPSLQHPLTAVGVFTASVVVVLLRRPAGSLLKKRNGAAGS